MKSVTFTGFRDANGYELKHYPARQRLPGEGTFLISEGAHIVGRSGHSEKAATPNAKTWRRLLALDGPESLVEFMNEFGPLGRNVSSSEIYENSWILLEPLVQRLRQLASYAEAFDREGFEGIVQGREVLLQRFWRTAKPGLQIEFKSLADYLVWQMWNLLRERDTPAQEVMRKCKGCEQFFRVGAGRGEGRRVGAIFHSRGCADAYRKRQKRRVESANSMSK